MCVYINTHMYICLYRFHLGLCKRIGELGDGVYRRSLEGVHIDAYIYIIQVERYRKALWSRACERTTASRGKTLYSAVVAAPLATRV